MGKDQDRMGAHGIKNYGLIAPLFATGSLIGLTDAELLDRFVDGRGELSQLAFAAIVDRHGSSVLRACRAMLANGHDAEDAFQVTFLVLARKAPTLQLRGSLGPWLHRVACRVASHSRRDSARRRKHENRFLESRQQFLVADRGADDTSSVVHEEIDRLPESYRVAIVLCDLQGCSYEEAGRRMGWSAVTIKGRLARGRRQLRQRLIRRGIASGDVVEDRIGSGTLCLTGISSALKSTTVDAAIQLASKQLAAGAISVPVGRLMEGVLEAMFLGRLRIMVAATVLGLSLAAGGGASILRTVAASQPAPADREHPETDTRGIEPVKKLADQSVTAKTTPPKSSDEPEARRLALAAHTRAGAFSKLPRFDYQVRYRHGDVDSMRTIDVSVERLKEALTAPVKETDWIGFYETRFAWDEQHFLWEMNPEQAKLNYHAEFWTRSEAWERHEANDKSSTSFVRTDTPSKFWKSFQFFDYSYLRLAPYRYWWGLATEINGQTMSLIPPEKSTWRRLGVETFGDEECDLVDSPQRGVRLWIGRDTGHIRGVLTYWLEDEYQLSKDIYKSESISRIAGKKFNTIVELINWERVEASDDQLIQTALVYAQARDGADPSKIKPNELILFDSYREVAKGVWLPSREVRSFPHASETVQGKSKLIRSELRVKRVRTDVDLTGRLSELKPKDGDMIEDQRHNPPTKYPYKSNRVDN